jgi:hypothetical protein
LDTKHGVPAPYTTLGVAAAMLFRARDEEGRMHPKDEFFVREIYPRGMDFILREVCGLDPERERTLINNIKRAYRHVIKDSKNWFHLIDQTAETQQLG